MSMKCEDHRKRILEASIEDLSPEEHHALEAHLADCPSCAEERRLTLDIVQQLRSESDVAVPRHFFVSGEECRPTPWSLFQQMTLTWKAATAMTLLAVGVLAAMAVSSFQIRTQTDGVTLSLGKPAEPQQSTAPSPVNVDSLKADILQALEEKSRQERLLWVQDTRKELALSSRRLTQKQQKSLEAALAELEARVNDRMITRDLALQANWKQSLGDLYGTIQVQRKRDLLATKNGIDRLAARGEVRSSETEAILGTLLQVAEYKMK
jgi:Putative zinc-finger